MSPQLTRGQREYAGLMGSSPEEGLAEVRMRSPQMYDAVVEAAFGQMMAQAGLSRTAREMTTVALLAAAGGAERQLATHACAALRHGVAPAELRALCEHVAVYAGFPRALNALEVIDRVLTQAGAPAPPALRRVRLADHETVVAQSGTTGPAVVLIHALGLDWRMWAPVLEQLSAGRRVFAYDLRATAGRPAPRFRSPWRTPPPTWPACSTRSVSTEPARGGERSYGGGIAQTAALAYPGTVRVARAGGHHGLPVRDVRGAGSFGRDGPHGGPGRPQPDPLVRPQPRWPPTGGACATRASACGAATRSTGRPRGGRSRGLTSRTGSARSASGPWSWRANSTPPRRRS